MNENEWLAEQFETNRSHLRAVAYRMLGSLSEADDAVQETWLRLSRAGTDGVENIGGWMTTIAGRVCLDMLRTRKSRREDSLAAFAPDDQTGDAAATNPEHQAVMADSVGLALLVLLETLSPNERLAFVLHDVFAMPFEEISDIVGRSPAATRQLASRARRRVQGVSPDPDADSDLNAQREVVDAFLAASRGGDFDALLAILDPGVVYRTDMVTAKTGAEEVAKQFAGRAKAAQPALVDGAVGLVWAPGGKARVVFGLTIEGGKIVEIDLIADPDHLARIDLEILSE